MNSNDLRNQATTILVMKALREDNAEAAEIALGRPDVFEDNRNALREIAYAEAHVEVTTIQALQLGTAALAGHGDVKEAVQVIRSAMYRLEDNDGEDLAEYELLRQLRKTIKANIA